MKPTTRLIRYSDHIEMAWKNGAGKTREIARVDDDEGLLWRLSLATLTESGPFSVFPATDRIIALIEGEPMTLHFEDGEILHLAAGMPRRFSCERPLNAQLSSAGHRRDLNLLFRNGEVDAHAEWLRLTSGLTLGLTGSSLVIGFVVSGTVYVKTASNDPLEVREGDTFIYDSGDPSGLDVGPKNEEAEILLYLVTMGRPSAAG